jgi:hypothetical protein
LSPGRVAFLGYNHPVDDDSSDGERERDPKDPRVVFGGRHRERGPAKFVYTYADIARAAGVAPKTARNAAVRGKRGVDPELDPRSLESVVAFIARRRAPVPG